MTMKSEFPGTKYVSPKKNPDKMSSVRSSKHSRPQSPAFQFSKNTDDQTGM